MKPPNRSPRGLSEGEAAVWARLAASVVRLHPPPHGKENPPDAKQSGKHHADGRAAPVVKTAGQKPLSPAHPVYRQAQPHVPVHRSAKPVLPSAGPRSLHAAEDRPARSTGLDSHWERRLRAGIIVPDFTIDLHEHSLDAAYQRLLGGLDIAQETGARVVLVIAGRERPAPAADRGHQRGAIRAKLLDWLAASRHAHSIATVRKAHRRHSGEGALYVIFKKPR